MVVIPGIIYLAALVFGLGIQALQFVMAGADADADVDADVDVDGDADFGGDADHDLAGHAGGHEVGGFLPILLSVRFWTFGALAFGLSGSLLHFLQLAPASVTPIVAVAAGLVAGFFASWAFKQLARSMTTSGASEVEAVGQVGKVLVPLKGGARGKVRIQLRGQTTDYLALSDDGDFEEGADVLITEIEDGQVRIARAPSEFLLPQDDE
jgi:membrane protein implicated in regulation of membrane protease activity